MTDRIPFFARLTSRFLGLVFRATLRLRVEGLEHLPKAGPLLIVANHASNADGMLLMAFVTPSVGRPIGWLGKEEALHWPILGWTMRQNGVFGVRRGAGDIEAFRTAKGVLDAGGVLGIFPEGTRSPTGSLQEAKEGATVFALRSGAPIVPIAIAGTHRFWAKGTLIPRPGKRVTIRVGEPFTLSRERGAGRRQGVEAATRELMRHIAELLPPDQRGAYGDDAVATAE